MRNKMLALIAQRNDVNQRGQALAALSELSLEQVAEFEGVQAQFKELSAQIGRLEQAEQMAAAAAVPVGQPTPATPTYAQPRQPEAKGAGVAQMVAAMVAAGGIPSVAASIAEQRGYGPEVSAALSTGSSGAGGVLVPTNLSSEVVELLRPKSVVRSLGARSLPLNNGNITLPRLKGGAVVGYIGSDSDIPSTQPQFDDLKLSGKKMAALVPMSNDLLINAGKNYAVDSIVVADLTAGIASREDKAFIRDDGTGNTPKGLLHWALSANKVIASDGATIQKVETDLGRLILLLESANVGMSSPGFIMAPRSFRFLADMRDANGNKAFPEMAQGLLKGYAVKATTQIPVNLVTGASINESEIYFADFGDCFIGEGGELRIDYSKDATYKDDQGNVISAYQRDQTLVRVITAHDFGPRHQESIAVLTAVKWGA